MNEYQSEVVILLFPLSLLQVFLPLILAISLLACATTAIKTVIIGEIAQPETLRANSTTPSQACTDTATVRNGSTSRGLYRCHAFRAKTIMNSTAI